MMEHSSSVTAFSSQPTKLPEPDQQCALLEYKSEGEHYKMPEQVVLKFRKPFISSKKGKITITTVVLLTLAIAGTVTFLFTYHSLEKHVKAYDDKYEIKLNYSSILRKNVYWASLTDFVPSVEKSSRWMLVDMARENVTRVTADQKMPFGGTSKWSNHLFYFNASNSNVNQVMLNIGDLLRSEPDGGSLYSRNPSDFFLPDHADEDSRSKQSNSTAPRSNPLPIKPMSLY